MKPAVDMLRKRDGIWAQHGLLTPLAPLPEVSRTQNGKLFDLGGGQLHLSTSIGPAHYYDEDWLEIDTTLRPVAGETYLRTEATPYICEVETDRVAWRYQSREGGTVEVELVEVDGAPVSRAAMRPQSDDDQMYWNRVASGVDIKLAMLPHGIEDFKRLSRPTVLSWRIRESRDFSGVIQEVLRGWDKSGESLEVISNRDGDLFREEWTGRVARVADQSTRIKTWFDDPNLPVIVDASISENVTDAADDGYQWTTGTAWAGAGSQFSIGQVTAGIAKHAGVRFRTIAIPATSTISAATLTLSFNPLTGSPSFKIYADDVDDAALWANGNVPSNITKTTAKATWSPTATGTSTLNILGLASEVLVRTGWASGNDIRFALLDNAPGTSTHKLTLRGYNHISLPQLDVTFTPPPSGPGGGLTLRGAG